MTALPDEHIQHQLLHLAETVKDDYGRMDLSSMWRPYGRYMSQRIASTPMSPEVEIRSCNCCMLSSWILCVPSTDCMERNNIMLLLGSNHWIANLDKVAVSIS